MSQPKENPSSKRSFVVFANDPGTRNYGYAVLRVTVTKSKQKKPTKSPITLHIEPLEHGINCTVLDDLRTGKAIRQQLNGYLEFVQRIQTQYSPTVFGAERFMVRRASSGVTTEYVAFMLGAAVHQLLPSMKSVRLLSASTWKNAFNRRTNGALEAIYAKAEELAAPKKFGLTPHQIDAYLIGVYVAHACLGLKGFEFLSKSFIRDMVKVAPPYQAATKSSRVKKKRTKKETNQKETHHIIQPSGTP